MNNEDHLCGQIGEQRCLHVLCHRMVCVEDNCVGGFEHMSCILSMFLCAECKKPIENPSSIGQKYCDNCKKKRAVESRAYHRYMVKMINYVEERC